MIRFYVIIAVALVLFYSLYRLIDEKIRGSEKSEGKEDYKLDDASPYRKVLILLIAAAIIFITAVCFLIYS